MTVNELIAILNMVPQDERDRTVRVWLPGSQIDIDCFAAFPVSKEPDGSPRDEPFMALEGAVVANSLLKP